MWEPEQLHSAVIKLTETLGIGLGKVAQPLRVAVTGSSASPAIDMTLSLLGRDKTLSRLAKAIKFIEGLN
jgi:glutamyl-tRNA synthetase